jgi:hypothetical protein
VLNLERIGTYSAHVLEGGTKVVHRFRHGPAARGAEPPAAGARKPCGSLVSILLMSFVFSRPPVAATASQARHALSVGRDYQTPR